MSDADAEADALLAVADELYALPLAGFTPARDARAKQLKADGDAQLAARVKALRKPSLAAWVLGLLARRQGEQVAQVLDVGAALREAQAGMSADDLRGLTRQRRQLTAAITAQARSLAREDGVRTTEAVAGQIEGMLTAAVIDERCGRALRSGLLVATLTTTGVGDLGDADVAAALAVPEALGFTAVARDAATPEPPDLRVVPDPDAAAKAAAAARERLTEAEEQLARAQEAHDDAAAGVEELRARQLQIEGELDELGRRVAELEQARDDVDEELDEAEAAVTEAADQLADAVAERDAAQRSTSPS